MCVAVRLFLCGRFADIFLAAAGRPTFHGPVVSVSFQMALTTGPTREMGDLLHMFYWRVFKQKLASIPNSWIS